MTIKYLSKEKINEALDKALMKDNRTFYIIATLIKTGVRVSELLSITPNDLLIDQKQLIIRGKGNKIRNIDISYNLATFLQSHMQFNNIKNNERVFKITRQRVYQITKEVAGCNPHMFRHSYAIHLLRKTKNIRYVQVQLGHSTIISTQVYLRYMDFEEEKKKLDSLYS